MSFRDGNAAHLLGLHVVEGVLIAPAPGDCDDDALLALKKSVLAKTHAASVRKVLIDVSRMQLMDAAMFELLASTARMAALLGAEVVFVGFQPGVVTALVDLDVEFGDLRTAVTVEDGLDMLRKKPDLAQERDGEARDEAYERPDAESGEATLTDEDEERRNDARLSDR